ncbi:MAG: SDR family NAD(P)-dependent oxidoreductase [Francisellaceae bacterium]|nr:SDR family NAD(P)-dependent oxidoreductase [Francisellaceae bacterium]MBT6539711.1 SDR family NAD(P)-dependent oxidoreductase [Francisellaceae bacterium]
MFLVSGSTGEIGRHTCQQLAKHNANLIIMGRNIDELNLLYDACIQPNNSVHIMQFDFLSATPDDYENLAQVIQQEYQHLNAFINLAATWGSFSPIAHYNVQKWYEVLQINLNAVFMLIQAILPILQLSHSPQIIYPVIDNICKNYIGALGVANAGIEQLMSILKNEHKNSMNLKITKLQPGPINSALYRKGFPGIKTPEQTGEKIAKDILMEIFTHQCETKLEPA